MLIVSIVLAAMAPVITTKMKRDMNNSSAGGSSIWSWTEDKDAIYFGSDGKYPVLVGQTKVESTDPKALLVLRTDSEGSIPNHILFKKGNNVIGFLKFIHFDKESDYVEDGSSIAMGKNPQANFKNAIAIGNVPEAGAKGAIIIGNSISQRKKDLSQTYTKIIPKASGISSVAIGSDVIAEADSSIAIGEYSQATGANSIAIGSNQSKNFYGVSQDYGTVAQSNDSIAIGRAATVKENSKGSIAIGNCFNTGGGTQPNNFEEASVQGEHSIAIGNGSRVYGSKSIALGLHAKAGSTGGTDSSNVAIGYYARAHYSSKSIAVGEYALAEGDNGVALGYSAKANGGSSIAIGKNAKATSDNAVAIGPGAIAGLKNEITLGTSSSTVYIPGNLVVAGDVELAINNGTYVRMRSGWLNDDGTRTSSNEYFGTVGFKGGDYSSHKLLNIFETTHKITVSSDRRLKYVGKENKDGLDKLRQLKVFNYTFKKDPSKEPRVGVIAQDLQKVFPNAVKKGSDGFLTIRMEDMFYALVNAVKELDTRVTRLEKENKILKEQNKALDARLKALEAKIK